MLPLYLVLSIHHLSRSGRRVTLYEKHHARRNLMAITTLPLHRTKHTTLWGIEPCWGNIITPSWMSNKVPRGLLNIFVLNLVYLLASLLPSWFCFSDCSSFQVSDINVTELKASIRTPLVSNIAPMLLTWYKMFRWICCLSKALCKLWTMVSFLKQITCWFASDAHPIFFFASPFLDMYPHSCSKSLLEKLMSIFVLPTVFSYLSVDHIIETILQ